MAFMPNMSDQDKIVLLEMLETGELCDLTITGNDESEFRVHSEVLSSVSKKLAEEVRKSPESKLILPVSSKSLRLITKFAYEGPSKCELSEDCLHEIIEMTKEFDIDKLQELSCNFLEDHVNKGNFKKFLKLSQLLSISDCMNKIVEFIALNIKDLPDSEIGSLQKQEFLHIIEHECLNLSKDEASVLTKMWVDNNHVIRSQEQKLYEASQQETASRIPAEVVLSVAGWEDEPSRHL